MRGESPTHTERVVYLVALRQQNSRILNEFAASLASLRRFHPDVPVTVYHSNVDAHTLEYFRGLPGVRPTPIGIDYSGRFAENNYLERHGWVFPELYVLAAKIDTLLLTPGNTLFLDTDTEVLAPLDDCFGSDVPWMYEFEGMFTDPDRNQKSVLEQVDFETFGWRGDPDRLAIYNSGAVYVPQRLKPELYKAKEFLWCLGQIPADERGDNRLDEQLALSVALQEAVGYEMRELAPRVYHYWLEKYEKFGEWYERVHATC